MEKSKELSKTLQIGITCVCAYLVRYYMANILSVTSPDILQAGAFTKEFIGLLASAYMLAYASGQLINGVVGDIVKPKIMVVSGMMLCGFSSLAFTFVEIPFLKIVLYGSMGFFLSMLRGPLVKTISENTPTKHSRVICLFLSFSSFVGPLIASLISTFFNWKNTFRIAGLAAILIGCIAFTVFTIFEKQGKITYTLSKKSAGFKNILTVFNVNNFKFYLFIVMLCEFSAELNLWIPTYISEKLAVDTTTSKMVYSTMAFIRSFTPFITLFFFNFFKEKDVKMMRFSFSIGALMILGVRFIEVPFVNILFILLAQIAIGTASSLIWSIYIPAQKKSGVVSSINGILDFSGYIFSSIATMAFSKFIEPLGWNFMIIVWLCVAIAGILASSFAKQTKYN